MTNHWIDIKNADAILIMGSNAAENHPISFKWVLRAKDKGAVVMHVDPKFSRTSARSTFHVPLRSGTDIPFLGGMIRYILENDLYQKEYVVEYTNASFLVGEKYGFKDGLFTGYDAATRSYDKALWAFQTDDKGIPKKDKTLQDPRCVFNILKKHYDRYDLETVSRVTGVSKENLLKTYQAYGATGKPDKSGTIMYALGWTQHTVGVQNIRLAAILQLLLGNIGVAGGGINALRGEPNVQGSTDHCLLWHILPGYMAVPRATWPTLKDYNKANTPVSNDPESANWWQNKPKYITSLLKGWYGENGTKENDFGYRMLPKAAPGKDYSYLYIFDRMYNGRINGGFVFGTNPLQSAPNSNKNRAAMDQLDWLVVGELHHTETSDNWHRPGVDPNNIKTEVFLLPSAHRVEKSGSVTNSGRWLIWHDMAKKPIGRCRTMGAMIVDIMNGVRRLYARENGAYPDPLLKLDWPAYYDSEDMAQRINGRFLADTVYKGKILQGRGPGPQLRGPGRRREHHLLQLALQRQLHGRRGEQGQAEGPEPDGHAEKHRALPQLFLVLAREPADPLQPGLRGPSGKSPGPPKGRHQMERKRLGGRRSRRRVAPHGNGQGEVSLYHAKARVRSDFRTRTPRRPLPEHYEPVESPLTKNPFSAQFDNPCFKKTSGEMDALAKPGDPRFPIVLTTYTMTEMWCGGAETRNTPNLLEAEPQLYVEMSHDLAALKGIKNGDAVVVESARGKAEAVAMVTVRITPFMVEGKTVHLVGMPFCYGWTTKGVGDATNRLTASIGDPNTGIPEYKALMVNVTKAQRLGELQA